MEALVASLLKMLRDLLASGPSSHEKHLEIFFKICHMGFWRLDLVTCSRLILVAKNTFCTNWVKSKTVFKNFSVFLRITCYFISCPPLHLPKPPFSLTKPPFSSSIIPQTSRKGTGFLLFSKYFMFLALDFLDFVFLLRFENMMLEYGLLMFC